MKILTILISSILIIFFVIKFIHGDTCLLKNEEFYVGIPLPKTGGCRECGKEIERGINLCLNEINKNNCFKIKPIFRDCKNDESTAMRLASDFSFSNKVLLVIGHFSNLTTMATKSIYIKNSIPVICASPTDTSITSESDWHFNIIPNDNFLGSLILKLAVSKGNKIIAVIYDNNNTGLFKNIETAAETSNIELRRKWKISNDKKNSDGQIKKIINELNLLVDKKTIILATNAGSAIKIITSLKYPGSKINIVGSYPLSCQLLIEKLKQYPLEQVKPGYYSDDIDAVSPFILGISNLKAAHFNYQYKKKYKRPASWVSGAYYDALYFVSEVIKRSGIQDSNDLRKNRMIIKETISEIQSPINAIVGVTGDIYLNDYGERIAIPKMGKFKNHNFLSFFYQFQLLDPEKIDTKIEGLNNSNIIPLDSTDQVVKLKDNYVCVTKIVFVGIDIIRISNLNLDDQTYNLQFYIWLYSREKFNDDIVFTNAFTPVKLKPTKIDLLIHGIKIKAYEVTGIFKGDFKFHNYPFDEHILKISFRNKKLIREKLIYAIDNKSSCNNAKCDINEWKVKSAYFNQTDFKKGPNPETQENYSLVNAQITIKRSDNKSIIRFFLPIFISLVMLFFIFFFHEKILSTLLLFLILFITNLIFYFYFNSLFSRDYIVLIEYIYMALFALIMVYVLLSYLISRSSSYNKILRRTGIIAFPLLIILLSVVFVFFYKTDWERLF